MSQQPWDAELAVWPALARRLVTGQFPEIAGDRVEIVGEGWDNVVHLFDGKWAFRFPRRRLGAELLATECAILPRIAPRLPRPVPAPRFVGKPDPEYPWPFAGARFLPGRSASEVGLTDAGRARLAAPLGRFLRTLHDLPIEGLAPDLPGDRLGRLRPEKTVPRARELLARHVADGLLLSAGPFLPFLEDLPVGPRPTVLLHGDFYAAHLLVDEEGGLTGVIDWGDVHAGDPATDLMALYTFLPPAARPAFLGAYGPIDDATRKLARLRAVTHSVWVLRYAHATGRGALEAEALGGLARLIA